MFHLQLVSGRSQLVVLGDARSRRRPPRRQDGHGDRLAHKLKSLAENSKAKRRKRIPMDTAEEVQWKKMSKQILKSPKDMTPNRMAHTIYSCRVAGYWDLELFEGLTKIVEENPRLAKELPPIRMSMSIQSFGMLAKTITTKESSAFFESSGKDFMSKLMKVCLDDGKLLNRSYGTRGLASCIHGLGSFYDSVDAARKNNATLQAFAELAVTEFIRKAPKDPPMDQSFSVLLHGLANIRFSNMELIQELSLLLEKFLEDPSFPFGPQALGNIVWSLAKLGFSPEPLFELLGERLMGQMENLSPQELANTMYGYGVLRIGEPQIWTLMTWEAAKPQRLQRFSCQELANIVYACGLVDCCNEKALEAFAVEIVKPERLKKFDDQELSNMVYGLGLLNRYDHKLLQCLGMEIISPLRIKRHEEQGLANMIYGFGLIRYNDATILGGLGREACTPARLKKFSPQHLSNSVYGLGKSDFFDPFSHAMLMGDAAKRIKDFIPQEISNFTYGLALVGEALTARIPDDVSAYMEAVSTEVTRRGLGGFNLQELTTLCWSHSKLRYSSDKLMREIVDEYLRQVRACEDMKLVDGICMLLEGCANFGIRHDDLIRFAKQQIVEMNKGEIRQVTNAMQSLAVLNVLSLEEFEDMCKRLLCTATSKINHMDAMQVVQAKMYITIVKGEQYDPAIEPLIQSFQAASFQAGRTSLFEEYMSKFLRGQGVKFETDRRLVDDIISVDIFIDGEKPLVMECDGPTHYTVNEVDGAYRIMGRTCFRNQVLEAAGYTVSSIPYCLRRETQEAIAMAALAECNLL